MGFVLFCSSGNEPDITHLSRPLSLPSSLRSSRLYLLSPCASLRHPGLLSFSLPSACPSFFLAFSNLLLSSSFCLFDLNSLPDMPHSPSVSFFFSSWFYPTLLAYSTFHISLYCFFSPRLSLSSSVNLQICSFPSLLFAPFFFSTYLLNSPVPLLSYSSWAYSSAQRPPIIWMHWQFFFFFCPWILIAASAFSILSDLSLSDQFHVKTKV